tara:strand:- start:11592 stop:11759 length:168 start_codon:yes stop_codon:yes gene_type:complete
MFLQFFYVDQKVKVHQLSHYQLKKSFNYLFILLSNKTINQGFFVFKLDEENTLFP